MNAAKARLLVPVLALLLAPALARAEQKPLRLPLQDQDIARVLGTDYYGLYVLGKKIGWARVSLLRAADAKTPGYVMSLEMTAKILAAGMKTETRMSETQEFDAKAPYAFRGGVSRETDGQTVKEVKLSRTEKGIEVVVRDGDDEVRKEIPAPDFTLADTLTAYLWVRGQPKAGDTIATREFDFDDLQVDLEIRKYAAAKTAVADGVKTTYHEVEVTLPKEGITGLERYDKQGERVLSMKVAGFFELRLEPEKIAKNTEFSGDLFELGKVKIDKKLGDESKIESLVLETVGKPELNLKSGPCQAVVRGQSGAYTLKLGKPHGVPAKATPQEMQENLAETGAYPITHAKVRALGKEAVGDAKTDQEKVARLVRFVSEYVTPSYSAEPLTLLELLRTRKGDCSEYAMLFAALARAAGIPCREVAGLVYMGDEEKAFGFHAWNEVVLDGHWVPVDPAAGETEISATHISFGTLAGEQVVNLLASIGKLRFRVVEMKHRQ